MRVALISFIAGFFTSMFALFTGLIGLVRENNYGFFFIGWSIIILAISIKFLNEDRNG